LKGRGLVSAAVPGFSTNGEVPGSAIKPKSLLVKEFYDGRTYVLLGVVPALSARISAESSDVLG
jgi:hypothetical protein